MKEFEYYVLARALHVVCVVLWIGGVAFVTSVLIPSLRRKASLNERLDLFEALENRFSFQAKITTLLTGLSGFYMLYFTDTWSRYVDLQFWWLHLMTLVWLVFTIVLFVLEPLFLHRFFHEKAAEDSDAAFSLLHMMHVVLLLLSLVAVLGAVTGSHGF
jgi:uncharacterized membrane protein